MERSICHRVTLGSSALRRVLLIVGLGVVISLSIAPAQAQQPCGTGIYPFPYTDVSAVGDPFCPGIMEAYVTGVTRGTTPTTFSPNDNVPRVQMTTFLQRTLDQVFTRTSRRAAFNHWWVPQNTASMQSITLTGAPQFCDADGDDIWASNFFGQVIQVQANTGKLLGTWTGAAASEGVVAVAGKVFVAGSTSPGNLYLIDSTLTPGAVITAASTLGDYPYSIAFDGTHLWTANDGSVSIITLQATTPYPVSTVTTGFIGPYGILYDGKHIWVTDFGAGTLLQLDSSGNILQTVTVGAGPQVPGFDGTNIWVPNALGNSITVVQASTGRVMATMAADASNLLNSPSAATFDGERVLVTNTNGNTVSVFKAADLSFIANVATGSPSAPFGACSDGINFWVPLPSASQLLRF
jgi:DNA-binding beta-propeller fold protein YncE